MQSAQYMKTVLGLFAFELTHRLVAIGATILALDAFYSFPDSIMTSLKFTMFLAEAQSWRELIKNRIVNFYTSCNLLCSLTFY